MEKAFTLMNKTLVITSENSPLNFLLDGFEYCDVSFDSEKSLLMDEYDHFIDLTLTSKEQKYVLFSTLKHAKSISTDATNFDFIKAKESFPNLSSCFSTAFYQEGKKVEVYSLSHEASKVFSELKIDAIEVDYQLGFTLARVLVQIINEAYFAQDEMVATKTDIDTAMKFGVNYPKGPFEWSEGKEVVVAELLSELQNKYNDKRYEISESLRKYL